MDKLILDKTNRILRRQTIITPIILRFMRRVVSSGNKIRKIKHEYYSSVFNLPVYLEALV